MKDKRHAWVTLKRSPSTRDDKTRVFALIKGTYYTHYIYMCCYRIPVVYINMLYHILFKEIHYTLSYCTHKKNGKIKNAVTLRTLLP